MAAMSTAWYSAWRTRLSFSGFLPLMLEPFQLVAELVEAEEDGAVLGPSMTWMLGSRLMRSRSCTGGSTTMSTWPESSAAERVAAALMGVNTMSSMLPLGLSHQAAFFFSVVLVSGCQASRMKGPVPLALREAKFSSLAL
jgi:hypothetical protein